MPTEKSELLTTGQAAKLCSVTPDTILKWIKRGRLRGVRTAGGHYRIERHCIEPFILHGQTAELAPTRMADRHAQQLRCWEYLSDRGEVRDECRQCVVYRVRAARCFEMAGLEPDVGHSRRFCQSSCEDCVYYRRVKGLATNVLLISSDDDLVDHLSGDDDDGSITLRFARNAYEASAIIQDFRPAFAAIDIECFPSADIDIIESLAADSRVPGLMIVLVVPPGMPERKRNRLTSDLVVSVLEKPFGMRRLAEAVESVPADS